MAGDMAHFQQQIQHETSEFGSLKNHYQILRFAKNDVRLTD